MKVFRLMLMSFMILGEIAYSASELDFSNKRNYFLGEGEFGSVSLQLKSAETYDFEPGINRPFVLKKLNNSGLIEVIFDARTMDAGDLTEGKTYTTSFVFTKKNIGKKELLNVSGIYRPELRIIVKDSLFTDFIKLDFTPDRKTFTVKMNALKNINNLIIEDPKRVISFGGNDRLSVTKGLNEFEVSINKEENFSEEIYVYRKLNEGKANQLYFIVTARDFKAAQVDVGVEEVTDEEIRMAMVEDSLENAGLYSEMEPADTNSASGTGEAFSLISMIAIGVLAVIILVLLIIMALKRKDPLFETYQTFFDDVATLVNVSHKGVNLEKAVEEIMMILLDKFEYGASAEEKKKTEAKRVLKKPAGLTSPSIQKPAQDDVGIDLNFDSHSKDEAAQKPKPAKSDTGEKKISRGFDFLDEE
jgi:hypothetical protein